ncbi:uncharacterized protein BDZ99DRAFT_577636 [Mytilinidion resinicola]|uniref:Mg2+ transporter protein n=1 Tax=Mytilinidion resinicola TaxID=574789 RepID=A0A6A6XXS9_9PEZI|nr:uncharacterized protein BDZ99DRAFT_577636 [Mytilinidion resinicola]KAF2801356.1 hypothetical protein BDZ99DRAFT_577636 [Mytilinidion resinicola]
MAGPQTAQGSKQAPKNIAPASALSPKENPPESTSPLSPLEDPNVIRTVNFEGLECDSVIWKSSENKWNNGKVNLDTALSKKRDERSDIEIYFLPTIKKLVKYPSMTEKMSTEFHVPRFFWTHTGWNANGFFGSHEDPLGENYEESFVSYSRFLVKELLLSDADKDTTIGDPREQSNTESHNGPKTTAPAAKNTAEGYGYQWQFIAFFTFWFLPKEPVTKRTEAPKSGSKQVVFCFDQSPTMKRMLKDAIEKCSTPLCQACPYGIFEPLLSTLFTYYDWALWDFQKPVRDIERARDDFSGLENYNRADMYIRYVKMHELARHIIHLTETLGVGARTLRTMRNAHSVRCKSGKSVGHYHQIQGDLEFYELFLQNLQARASAFDQRLNNEIKLAFNLFAADDNATQKEILKESQNDGRDLTNLVALLTLIFLPASFLTGFFGMHFFDIERSQPDLSHPKRLWLYFAVAGPVSAVAIMLWYGFRKWKAQLRGIENQKARGTRARRSKPKQEDLGNLKRAESWLAPPGQHNNKDFAFGSKTSPLPRAKLTSNSPPNA